MIRCYAHLLICVFKITFIKDHGLSLRYADGKSMDQGPIQEVREVRELSGIMRARLQQLAYPRHHVPRIRIVLSCQDSHLGQIFAPQLHQQDAAAEHDSMMTCIGVA